MSADNKPHLPTSNSISSDSSSVSDHGSSSVGTETFDRSQPEISERRQTIDNAAGDHQSDDNHRPETALKPRFEVPGAADQTTSFNRTADSEGTLGEELNQPAEGADQQTIYTLPKVTRESQGAQRVSLPEVPQGLSLEERSATALRMAQEAFAQTGYWVAFYKAILAKHGVVNQLFPKDEELDYFHTTTEFYQIQQILTALRMSDVEKVDAIEPLKMLTIRIPKSMQAALMAESKRNHTSINKLCISKLLCPIDPVLVPREQGKVKGRKPKE